MPHCVGGFLAAFKSPTFGLQMEVGFVGMVIKPSPQENTQEDTAFAGSTSRAQSQFQQTDQCKCE